MLRGISLLPFEMSYEFLIGDKVMSSASLGSQTLSAAGRPSDIVMMDGLTLAGTFRARQASCVEVMTAYLDHIERLNPHVNAIVALEDRAALLAQARERDAHLARGDAIGPLHGFPHAVK